MLAAENTLVSKKTRISANGQDGGRRPIGRGGKLINGKEHIRSARNQTEHWGDLTQTRAGGEGDILDY